MYVIQGIMANVLICFEDSVDSACEAYDVAKGLLKDPTFEGDTVRIITIDSELVWGPYSKNTIPS